MSSLKFEELGEDLEDLLDRTSKRLQIGISRNESADERKRIIYSLEKYLEEAKFILNKMEIESLHAPSKYQIVMQAKLKKYTSEIQNHRNKLNEERYVGIFGGPSKDIDSQLRKQVLMGTASLERTAESLERSRTIAVETEEIGTGVLGELGTQRETLERVRERLGETQEEISRTKRVLRALGQNVFYNKILLIIIIVLEVLTLGGLVYWRFFT